MGEQHRLGETRKIEAGDRFDTLEFVAALRAQNRAVGGGEFDLGLLQRAVGLIARPALAPEGAVRRAFDLEFDLGEAIGGMPRHDLVARC